MKKQVLAAVLAVAVAASLAGCGNIIPQATSAAASEAGAAPSEASAETENAGVEEKADAVHFDLSTTASPGSLLADYAQYFADQVKELSDGTMVVDVYLSSALGSEAQNLESLTAGTLDLAIVGVEFYTNTIRELGALMLPYMYTDYDQVQAVLTGEAGEYASQRLREEAGVENLGYYVMMFRNMYLNKPINSVEDFAGVKIRVPESNIYVNTMKMMGGAPTPMAMSEVYTSCETGVIDGFENTPDTCYNQSMYEVLKYMNMTRHLNAPTTMSMSAKVYDSLTDEQKEIFHKAGLAAGEHGLETTKNNEAELIDQLKDLMTIVDTDTASMKALIDYNSYDFMASDEAQRLYELVLKEVEE